MEVQFLPPLPKPKYTMLTFSRLINTYLTEVRLSEKLGLGTEVDGQYTEIYYAPTPDELLTPKSYSTVDSYSQLLPVFPEGSKRDWPYRDGGAGETPALIGQQVHRCRGIITPTQLFVWEEEKGYHRDVLRAINKEYRELHGVEDPRAAGPKRRPSAGVLGEPLSDYDARTIPIYLLYLPKLRLLGVKLAQWSTGGESNATLDAKLDGILIDHPWFRQAGRKLTIRKIPIVLDQT